MVAKALASLTNATKPLALCHFLPDINGHVGRSARQEAHVPVQGAKAAAMVNDNGVSIPAVRVGLIRDNDGASGGALDIRAGNVRGTKAKVNTRVKSPVARAKLRANQLQVKRPYKLRPSRIGSGVGIGRTFSALVRPTTNAGHRSY